MSSLRPSGLRAPDGATSSDVLGSRPQAHPAADLARRVKAYDPKADTALLDAAYALAFTAHGSQRRDNGDPYITHPLAVADILAGYRLDTSSIVTALSSCGSGTSPPTSGSPVTER